MIARRTWKLIVPILTVLIWSLAVEAWVQGSRSGRHDPRDFFGPRFQGGHDAPRLEPSRTEDSVRRWNDVMLVANALDHTPVRPGENRVFGEQLGPYERAGRLQSSTSRSSMR